MIEQKKIFVLYNKLNEIKRYGKILIIKASKRTSEQKKKKKIRLFCEKNVERKKEKRSNKMIYV